MDNDYLYAFLLAYGLLGVLVIAFVTSILPALYGSFVEWLDDTVVQYQEHREFKAAEVQRHRRTAVNFFTDIVMENREVNEGRRMPVSIHG